MNKIRLIIPLLFVFAFFATPLFSQAAVFEKSKTSYYIQKEDVIEDDLYSAAPDIISYGEIHGDFSSAGNSVFILGNTSEDVNMAGGTVDIFGNAGDDVRVIGGQVRVRGEIEDDLIIIGGVVHILPEANVKGDVTLISGTIFMNGSINGSLKVFGGNVILNGDINKDANIQANQKLTVGPNTNIGGNLKYKAKEKAKIPETTQIGGEIVFSKIEGFEGKTFPTGVLAFFFASVFNLLFLVKLAMLLIPALLAIFLLPKFSKNIVEFGTEKFLRSLGIGLISFIVIPIASILLLASIIGLPIGIAGLLLYILMFITSEVFAGIILGAILAKWRKAENILSWKWAVLGVLLFEILILIPILGWIVHLLFFLTTFGTLSTIMYTFLQKRK